MKLAFGIFKYFPHGGLQRDMMRIAAEAVRRGHRVTVYAISAEGEIPAGVKLELLPVSGWSNHGRAKRFAAALRRKFEAEKPDLFFAFNRMPGADLYFAADNCFALSAQRHPALVRKLLPRYRTFLAFEEAIFTPEAKTVILYLTPGQLRDFQQVYHTPAERFRLLPPGIPADRRRPEHPGPVREAKRSEFGIAADEILLIQVGSGFRTKGVDRSLRAVAALPEELKKRTRLLVAGRDSGNTCPKLTASLGISNRVIFAGGRDDVGALLLAADLLIHPARNEATGTVLIEALAAGTPVMATANCGFANYVAESGGIVIPADPFDQETFDRELAAALSTPGRLEQLKQLAIDYGAKADFYRRAEAAVDYIEEAAHAGNR